MVVKIWPIKPGKNGGEASLKASISYVENSEKTSDDLGVNFEIADANSLRNSLAYMNDDKKIDSKWISGYLCNVDTAVQEFADVKEEMLMKTGKEDKGNIAFHIIQSFPLDLEISNEEIHKCGLELCEKIGLHQAIVCSHVNPVKNKKGIITGNQKHNHILINAYTLDPEKQYGSINCVKYHGCKETYAQLQQWNDEIALDHGLPIIEERMKGKSLTHYETLTKKEGLSWKEQFRKDINTTKEVSSSWDDFKKKMEAAGYKIREGKYISYSFEDKDRAIRDRSLGAGYSREDLESFWAARDEIEKDSSELSKEDNQEDMVVFYSNPLWKHSNVRIPTTNSSGRERTQVELIFLLAIVTLKEKIDTIPDATDNPKIYARTDWKLQNLVNIMADAGSREIESYDALEKRIHNVGTKLSICKHAKEKVQRSYSKMTPLHNLLVKYEKYPDAKTKEILTRYKLITPEEIETFKSRYASIEEQLNGKSEVIDDFEELAAEYKSLKKIEFFMDKAKDESYCRDEDEPEKDVRYNEFLKNVK
ncbi:MAG: relaxase/mobilization nuclease domain-containing protein [Oscillospiraceae bacterium]